ncbi:hypothetical protein J2I47_04380 [Fibrella sp. HMF5335]|uniref:Uncharacterized protein n=1 Tax=Fibrella rubiginis TaxID=2817060 RepID=A0A939GG20_9BACT|nr:hypothetical protein [Fibrella rubiginis]MBO0935778.1 hypothetical protein [Fibrella rubiginis]
MTTSILLQLSLTGAALLATAQPSCASYVPVPPTQNEARLVGQVVTIVRVKAPWYAFDFLLRRGFREALPTYQSVNGLRFKAFSSIDRPDGTFFGGIYWWDTERQARQWYSPAWFADVERKRKARPTVDYLPVVRVATFVAPSFNYRQHEGDCVTVFVHELNGEQIKACLSAQNGLLRTYLVGESGQQQGGLLLFASAESARSFVAKQHLSRYDWYKTPALLNNETVLSTNQ